MTGMHAGIGPPSTDHPDRLTGNFSQGKLQCILHSAPLQLTLPAMKSATTILKT
ncbi:MAG: hypothetical protein ACD_10C00636G0001 [uncultured bacterium]|nr:MAG: hypothetical protein ACD_10C00636G0001 [uncultured bacterium]